MNFLISKLPKLILIFIPVLHHIVGELLCTALYILSPSMHCMYLPPTYHISLYSILSRAFGRILNIHKRTEQTADIELYNYIVIQLDETVCLAAFTLESPKYRVSMRAINVLLLCRSLPEFQIHSILVPYLSLMTSSVRILDAYIRWFS